MHPEMKRGLEAGAVVLTATRRLARALRAEYAAVQKQEGRAAWASPSIVPWSAWIAERWRESLYSGVATRTLLNDDQELALWKQAIARSPEAEVLLQLDAAAATARDAWSLIHAWRLPQGKAHFDVTQDSAAFYTWMRWYVSRCEQLGVTDSARAPDLLREPIHTKQVWVAGFDEFTPQQEALLKALENAGVDVVHSQAFEIPPDNAGLVSYPEVESELAAAARWARAIVEKSPRASVGVVVPKLGSVRAAAERIFRDAVGGAFHISLGPSLAHHPPVRAALLLLETFHEDVPLAMGSEILLSPYAKGSGVERTARDLKLRRGGGSWWPVSQLGFGAMPAALDAVTMSEWCSRFSERLKLFGWPGDGTLSSNEYQAVEAWRGLLHRAATLDVVTPPMEFTQALSVVKRMARETAFQVEDPGCPVQIVGLAEVGGSEWDHLWISGLDEDSWPAAAEPNPFLPLALQRANRVPHSSPQRERDAAVRVLRRLIASAPDVVVSYSETEGEVTRGPSPLVAGMQRLPVAVGPAAPWYAVAAELESVEDSVGPGLPAGSIAAGGARTIMHQAACPFHAFAEFRLQARAMEEPDLGPDARKRGNLEHAALEHFWREMVSLEKLRGLGASELRSAAEEAASAALANERLPEDSFTAAWSALEHQRLASLVMQWADVELARGVNFTTQVEQKKEVEIGGLRLRTRADRVDTLPDGRVVLIDYKGTAPRPLAWDGARPDEPQLPIYAVTAEAPVAGVAFGNLQPAKFKLVGRAVSEDVFPTAECMDVGALVSEWRVVLGQLAGDFLSGRAEVDPKDKKSCAFCHLHALCRIRD